MDILFLKSLLADTETLHVGLGIGECCPCRLLHYIPDLACHKKLSLTVAEGNFNVQGLSSHLCPGKTSHESRLTYLLVKFSQKFRWSKIGGKALLCNMALSILTLGNLSCNLPADGAKFPFKLP